MKVQLSGPALQAHAESNGFLTLLSDGERLTGAYALGPALRRPATSDESAAVAAAGPHSIIIPAYCHSGLLRPFVIVSLTIALQEEPIEVVGITRQRRHYETD